MSGTYDVVVCVSQGDSCEWVAVREDQPVPETDEVDGITNIEEVVAIEGTLEGPAFEAEVRSRSGRGPDEAVTIIGRSMRSREGRLAGEWMPLEDFREILMPRTPIVPLVQGAVAVVRRAQADDPQGRGRLTLTFTDLREGECLPEDLELRYSLNGAEERVSGETQYGDTVDFDLGDIPVGSVGSLAVLGLSSEMAEGPGEGYANESIPIEYPEPIVVTCTHNDDGSPRQCLIE